MLIVLVTAVGCNRSMIDAMTAENTSALDHAAVGNRMDQIELLPLGLPTAAAAAETGVLTAPPASPTLVHFWGTWCPPCRAEYPELSRLVDSLTGRVGFMSVSCEGSSDDTYQTLTDDTAEFLADHNLRHTVYADLRGQTRSAFTAAAATPDLFYPTSILLDADHNIVAVWEGFDPANLQQMRSIIESM